MTPPCPFFTVTAYSTTYYLLPVTSARRPGKTSAGQHMKMQMLNRLSAVLAAIVDYSEALFEAVFLSEEQKTQREEAVVAKEKEAAELKRKYFGPEGELYKKRESLMSPIQDEIYNAVKDISEQKGYSLILDRASDAGIIFASPKVDISNEVLTKLGYN